MIKILRKHRDNSRVKSKFGDRVASAALIFWGDFFFFLLLLSCGSQHSSSYREENSSEMIFCCSQSVKQASAQTGVCLCSFLFNALPVCSACVSPSDLLPAGCDDHMTTILSSLRALSSHWRSWTLYCFALFLSSLTNNFTVV